MPSSKILARFKKAVSWGKAPKIAVPLVDHEAEVKPTTKIENKEEEVEEIMAPTLNLFSVPEEIFRSIMETLVLSDLKDAMRARLVCKAFDDAIWRALVDTRVLQGKSREKSTSYPRHLRAKYLERRTLRNPTGHYPSELALELVDNILKMCPKDHQEKRKDYLSTICKIMVTRHPGGDYSPNPEVIAGLSHRTANPPAYRKPTLEENTLVAAAWLGLNSVVKEILLADPTVRLISSILGSALEATAYHGEIKLARFLLEHELPRVPGNNFLRSVMHHIGWRDQFHFLQLLFEPHFNIRLTNAQLEEGIRQAAYHDNPRIIDYILEHAPMHDICGYSVFRELKTETASAHPLLIEDYILYRACLGGSVKTARRAIANDAHRGAYKSYPTMVYAATKGYLGIVQLLLEKKPDEEDMCDLLKKQLNTALTAAVRGDWPKVVEVLLDNGAECNSPLEDLKDKGCLLDVAIHNSSDQVVAILLKHGALTEDELKKSLEDQVKSSELSETVKLLDELEEKCEKDVEMVPVEKMGD